MSRVILPVSMEELWSLLRSEEDYVLFAGGTDMLVRRREGRAESPLLIGLERIGELDVIEEDDDGLFVGAGTTIQTIIENDPVRSNFPLLTSALEEVGSPPIRHMATLGGNICTASPAGDSLPPLSVLKCMVELRSERGSRTLSIDDFVLAPGRTALRKGELLYGVHIPSIRKDFNCLFRKVGLRGALAISVVSLAALYRLDKSGAFGEVRLAWGSVGPKVERLPDVEEWLLGKPPSKEVLSDAGRMVAERISPIDDVRATSGYRRRVAGNLLRLMAE